MNNQHSAQPQYQPPPKLDMGKAFKLTWEVFKANWARLLGLAAIPLPVLAVFVVCGTVFIPQLLEIFENPVAVETHLAQAQGTIAGIIIAVVVVLFALFLGWVWMGAAAILTTYRTLTGEKRGIRTVLRDAGHALGRLFAYNLLLFLGFLALYSLMILPLMFMTINSYAMVDGSGCFPAYILLMMAGISGGGVLYFWLRIKLGLVPFAIVIEKRSIGQAVRRSFALTKGSYWRSLGIVYLSQMVLGFVIQIISIPLMILLIMPSARIAADPTPGALFSSMTWMIVWYLIIMVISVVVYLTGMTCAWTGIFADLRSRHPEVPSSGD